MKEIKFTNSLTIAAPPSKVFSYISDLKNIPEWNYAIESTTQTSSGPVGEGTTYRQVRTIPRRAEENITITTYQPDSRLVVTGDLGPFAAELIYVCESEGAGTRLTNSATLQASGALSLIAPVLAQTIKSAVAENLQKLKSILEQ